MEINVDVEELQMFDGIAACANHTVNFKIGKFRGGQVVHQKYLTLLVFS